MQSTSTTIKAGADKNVGQNQLEARANRFGLITAVTQSGTIDDKKAARAARFADINKSTTTTKSAIKTTSDNKTNVGHSQLDARANRFGLKTAVAQTTTGSTTIDEKKAARAARFNINK